MTDGEFRTAFHTHKDVLFALPAAWLNPGMSRKTWCRNAFLRCGASPLPTTRKRGGLRPFLLGIARNLILKRWRDRHDLDPLEEEASTCGPVDLLVAERSQIVARAPEAPPPLRCETAILAEYEEMSLEEIAAVTGAELAAVKSRLHRARQNLRGRLAPLLEAQGDLYGIK